MVWIKQIASEKSTLDIVMFFFFNSTTIFWTIYLGLRLIKWPDPKPWIYCKIKNISIPTFENHHAASFHNLRNLCMIIIPYACSKIRRDIIHINFNFITGYILGIMNESNFLFYNTTFSNEWQKNIKTWENQIQKTWKWKNLKYFEFCYKCSFSINWFEKSWLSWL